MPEYEGGKRTIDGDETTKRLPQDEATQNVEYNHRSVRLDQQLTGSKKSVCRSENKAWALNSAVYQERKGMANRDCKSSKSAQRLQPHRVTVETKSHYAKLPRRFFVAPHSAENHGTSVALDRSFRPLGSPRGSIGRVAANRECR
jgi:hypothetical protein